MFTMERTDFTLIVNLQEYFSDDRKHSKIYVNRNYSKISDLEEKISELFGIKRFHLLSEGHYLPGSESVELLRNGELICVKPNLSGTQSIMLDDSFYDKDNDSFKRMILLDDLSAEKVETKRKRPSSVVDSNTSPFPEEVITKSKKKKKKYLDKELVQVKLPKLFSEMENEISDKDHFKYSQKESIQNQELGTENIKNEKERNKSCPKPVPFKKARDLKSWSTSPLPKSTNIVEITRVPIKKIELDYSRFAFTPLDNLIPSESEDTEVKIDSPSAEEALIDCSMESQQCSVVENSCVRNVHAKPSSPNTIQSQSFYESTEIVLSPNVQVSQKTCAAISETLGSCDKSNMCVSKNSSKMDSQKLPDDLKNGESQDSDQMKSVDFPDNQKKIVSLENNPDKVSGESTYNSFSNELCSSQTNARESSPNSMIEIQQEKNLPKLSEHIILENSTEHMKDCQSKFENRITELAKGVLKESRSVSRERWRHKLESHTKEVLKSFDLRLNDSERLNQSSFSPDCLSDEKLHSITSQNKVEKLEYFSDFDERRTTNHNAKALCNENSAEKLIVNQVMETEDTVKDQRSFQSMENFMPDDDNTEESTVSHGTIVENGTSTEMKRKRKRKHRRKKKDEIPPKREEINVFSTKMVTFVAAKPKMHIRFNSSDDENEPVKKAANIADESIKHGEKIKILQDITLEPNTNSDKHRAESEDDIGSSNGNEQLYEYFDGLLQMKKTELLRTHELASNPAIAE